MWRNRDVVDFSNWLRAHNASQPVESRVGFYGLDLYSLHASIDAVLTYLQKVDFDRTRALEPLERWTHDETDVPETFPTGI
jgi:erythromycin esterase-like protein